MNWVIVSVGVKNKEVSVQWITKNHENVDVKSITDGLCDEKRVNV